MAIFDEFLQYRDSQGLNQLETSNGVGITTQNGALFTMEYLICLMASEVDPLVKYQEVQRIVGVFKNLEVSYGLSVRFVGSTEYDSMDNESALLTFSTIYDFGIYALDMLKHGEETSAKGWDSSQDAANNQKFYWLARILSLGFQPRMFWNNQNPDLFCMQGWFGRSPAMRGLLKMTTDSFCSPFLWVSVWVGQFIGLTTNTTNTDARKLPYVVWQYLKNRSWFWKMSYKFWCWLLVKQYQNGMQDVYAMYYLSNPTHPIIKYSKPYV